MIRRAKSRMLISRSLPNVNDFTGYGGEPDQSHQSFRPISDVAEATPLLAPTENGQGFAGKGLENECWQHHSVATGLTGPYGVEETSNRYRDALLFPVCKAQELIQSFRTRVAPAILVSGPHHQVGLLAERDLGALSVDLRR